MDIGSSNDSIAIVPSPVVAVAVPTQGNGPQVMISRPPFTQIAFDEIHMKKEKDDKRSACQKLREKIYCSKKRSWHMLTKYVPIIKYVRYYNLKENAIIDLVAGLSVGTLHIPQALAFGLLASTKIQNGLFTSLWPVLIYVIFGTSAHVSMGTSAVICILTAATVDREGTKWAADIDAIQELVKNGTRIDVIPMYLDFKEQVAAGLSFIVGIMMIIMGLLRLGFITAYLSDSFFAAFTSAAAIHIGVSQIPPMLGITIPRFAGIFKIVKTFDAIFDNINHSNFADIIISIICCAIIWAVKDGINERYKQKMFAPIPIEFFIVIFGTIASHFGNFKEEFGIQVAGNIPTGLPIPAVPTEGLKYATNYIVDAFVLSILTFAYTIAIAKICAKKHNYQVDDSQEFLAYGLCNFISSFLLCIPSCVSPPRSMVASSMNAKTTLQGILSSILILIVILVVVTLFADLPKSVLAAIIFIALKNLFIQIGDFIKYWKVNKFDFVIWFFTFFGTVFLDIDVGLGVGVGIAVICLIFQTQFARGYKLGYTRKDPTLVEHKKYIDSSEIPGVKVFRFESSLYYGTAEIFRNSLYKCTVNPRKLLKALQKREKRLKKMRREREANGMSPENGRPVFTLGVPNMAFDNSDTDLPLPPEIIISEEKSKDFNADHELHTQAKVNGEVRNNLVKRVGFHDSGSLSTDDTKVSTASFGGLMSHSESMVSLYSINFDDYEEDPEDGEEMISDERLRQMRKVHHIIVDCSPITYIDSSGTNVLVHIFAEFNHVNIKLCLAGCSAYIRRTMELAGVFDKIPLSHFFVDVHDAVCYAKPQRPLPIKPEDLRDYSDEEAIEGSRVINA